MALCRPSNEKAIMAEIKIKAFKTMISKANNGEGFACSTFDMVGRHFGGAQPMQHRQPHHTLRLLLQPLYKLLASYRFPFKISGCLGGFPAACLGGKATADRRFDIRASKSGDLGQVARYLNGIREKVG